MSRYQEQPLTLDKKESVVISCYAGGFQALRHLVANPHERSSQMSAYLTRCQRAQALMNQAQVDWLFVSASSDLQYLTGFKGTLSERLTILMVPQSGSPIMVIPQFESVKLAQEGFEVFYDVRTWGEADNPFALVRETAGPSATSVAITGQMWSTFLLRIQEVLPASVRYSQGSEILGALRVRKDEVEVANLLEVGRRMDKVFEEACSLRYAGRTERDVAQDINAIVRYHGLSPDRANGVASGPNAASPHHRSNERTIQVGDAIWIELGCGGNYRGYVADMTRAVHVGHPSEEYVSVYSVVKEAQDTAWRAVRPGIQCQAIDRIARGIITEAGFGEYFTHRCGHGLGLDTHEAPYIIEGNTQPIEPGMVFSVEPGIYLPGRFGIRIEDILIATEDGVKNLYESTHDCVVVE